MQRILYCTDSLILGGTEYQLIELIARLDRTRFQPQVACLYGARTGHPPYFLQTLLNLDIPTFLLDVGTTLFDKWTAIKKLTRLVRALSPHIVHTLNYHSNGLMRLARPFLPRDLQLETSVYIEYTRKQMIYERLTSYVDTVTVCNAEFIADQLRSASPNRRLKVISNGIDLGRFSPRPKPSENVPTLVFVGRIAPQKAVHVVIEALALLKSSGQLPIEIQMLLVGDASDQAYGAYIDCLIHNNQLEGVVRCLPATKTPEIHFQDASFSVLPSLREGLPNTVLESLACGCPVLIADTANRAGLVQHEVNGWVVSPNEPIAWATAIKNALRLSSASYARLSREGIDAVQDYSMPMMVKQYEQLYASLSSVS